MEEKILKWANRIGNQIHLRAIRDGMILSIPVIIVGSVFLILSFLPISGYDSFMANLFGDSWQQKLLYPVGVSFDIMALIVVLGIAYRLAESRGVNALPSAVIAMVAFLLVTPYEISFIHGEQTLVATGIPLQYTGSKGIFAGIIVAIVSTEIYSWFIKRKITIKMPDGVPPAIAQSFASLIVFFVIMVVFLVVKLLLQVTPFDNMHMLAGELLQKPLSYLTGSYLGMMGSFLVIGLLWVVGIHGMTLIMGILTPILNVSMDENRIAFISGSEIPNIVTTQFMELITIGGSGVTLGLAFLLMFCSKSQQLRNIGKVCLIPALFNINEPIIFGLPIVMNPLLAIPFIIAPLAAVSIAYGSFYFGFVPKLAGIAIPWTTPSIISGYLLTGGHISASIMQLVMILVTTLIYYPFFKYWDKQKFMEENRVNM